MFYVLEHDWLFWPTFISLILTITIILMTAPYAATMTTRVTFGSFFVVIAIDYYLGSNLKYIIITIIRRVTIPEFYLAFVYPPFQTAGMSLFLYFT